MSINIVPMSKYIGAMSLYIVPMSKYIDTLSLDIEQIFSGE